MFFALGVTGFLFACLAPGYIAITAFKLQSRLPPLAGPFAISLIINNLLVEALVACGLYTHAIVASLAAITVFIAAAMLLFDKRLAVGYLTGQIRATGNVLAGFAGSKRTPLYSAIACVLVVLVMFEAMEFSSEFAKTAILGYDSLASWNRWALDWTSNIFPKGILHYPQLVPVLLSIPYVVTGSSDIQYFSVPFKILFWLFSFEAMAFVAVRRRDALLLFSIPFLYFIFHHWIGATSLEDYADVPVAFFSLLSAVAIIAENQDKDARNAVLALILASGAAMTKQVGFYMLAATPALIVVRSYEHDRNFASAGRIARSLLLPALLAAIAAAPMYVYATVTIRNGTNISELSYILDGEFGGLGYLARMKVAFARLFSDDLLPNIWTAVILVAGLAAVKDRIFRWPFLVIALPFTLLWAANFSYDNRNLALAMPFWALCAAVSLSRLTTPLQLFLAFLADIWSRLEARLPQHTYVVPILLLAAIAGAAVVKSRHLSYSFLLAEQYRVERTRLGDRPQCTEKMISLLQTLPAKHFTLSEWRWACQFHFNQNSCFRIFTETFFASGMLPRYAGLNLLVILNRSSLTPEVQTALQSAGMTPAGNAQCDEPASFFVRRAN